MSDQNSNASNEIYELLQDCLQKIAQKGKNQLVIEQAYTFLLLLWNHFTVYCDEDEGGEGGEGGTILAQNEVKQIKEKDTYLIFDHGNYLTTSVGAYYGSYSTQRLINSVRKMIAKMAERGVKKVRFSGTPAAQRVAQEECEKYKIKTNFAHKKSNDLGMGTSRYNMNRDRT